MKKKVIVGIFSVAALAAPVTLAVSCGGSDVKPTFYNYEAYINEDIQGQIEEVFKYDTFPDLNVFEAMIESEKTVGGIGSDYLNAKLAKNGDIQKIDFKRVFPSLENTPEDQIDEELQKIYTPESWSLMASFDDYITDTNNNGIIDPATEPEKHLYEYMVPYFIQNKVVAFDLNDEMIDDKDVPVGQNGHWWTTPEYENLTSGEEDKIASVFNANTSNDVNNEITLSYEEIFTTLRTHGYSTPIINDYWRDNLMIGSEKATGGFTNALDSKTQAIEQIAGFQSLVELLKPAGAQEWKVAFDTDGVSTLGKLIGHNNAVYDVATLYNGDAYDAYTNGEPFDDVSEKSIGVVKPTNSTYLLDGLVIPSYVSGNDLNSMYHVAKDFLFQGADQTTGDMKATQIYKNFQFVGYTTPYESLINVLDDAYFTPEGLSEVDKMAKYISVGMISGQNINSTHITKPIENNLQAEALVEYKNVANRM